MGGKRQANILSSIISNFQTVEDVIEASSDASGSALKENEKWMSSIEGKMNTFTNTLQTFWSNFIDTEVVKGFIDFATYVVKFLDTTPGKITAVIAALAGIAKFKGFSLKGLGVEALDSLNKLYAVQKTLSSLNNLMPVSANMPTDKIQIYASAVANLTAKQQAGSLAAAGLNKEQIKLALQYNNLSEEVTNEAMAHIWAKNAKKEEALTDTELIKNKILYKAAILEQVSSEDALAAAQFLRANATDLANGANIEALAGFKALTPQQQESVLLAYQQATANTTLAKSFKAVGASIKLAFITNPIGATITAITTLISVISTAKFVFDYFNTSIEETVESLDNAISSYRDACDTLNEQKQTVSELSKKYIELSNGVNTSTNTNISLTTASYEEYLNVCNQIADLYPELVAGYDAQGNAILTLKGKVDELNESYKRANENAALTFLTDKNKKDVWKVYEEKATEANSTSVNSTKSAQKKVLEAVKSMGYQDLLQFYEYDKGGNYAMWDILRKQLQKNGTYIDDDTMYSAYNSMYFDLDSLDEYRVSINQRLSQVNQDITTGMSGIRETVSASLVFNDAYQNLDESSKSIVKTILNNLDPDMIAESGADNADEFISWFSENIIMQLEDTADAFDNASIFKSINDFSDKISKAMLDGDKDAFKKAKADWNQYIKAEDLGWSIGEDGFITIDEDDDAIIKYLKGLANQIESESRNYEVKLQFQEDYESSFKKTGTKDAITETASELLNGQDAKEYIENAKKMSKSSDALAKANQAMINSLAGEDGELFSSELKDMYDQWLEAGQKAPEGSDWTEDQIAGLQLLDAMLATYNMDIDTLAQSLIDLKLITPSAEDVGTFDLSSSTTQDMINTFKENIDTIKEAWNSLNDGDMTKSDFIQLAMDFPEIMEGVDFSDDNWMVRAKENLEELNKTKIDNFLTKLNQMRSAMKENGEDTSIVDSVIASIEELQNMPLIDIEAKTKSNTISGLTEAYENYKSVVEETNEILYNGQQVSSDYYDSLKEYIDDVDELNSCFDKNNKRIVTNVAKLKSLIAKQKQETLNLTRTARAQAQLQYQDLIYDLLNATSAYEQNTSAGFNQIDSLLQQIDTVQDTIDQYKRLELSLLGATNAFEEFQKAKEIDSETDYESSVEEMIQALGEGFDSGKVGLETFNAAIKGLLPKDIYGSLIDTGDLDAVWKEFTSGNLSRFFTYSKDDGFDITLKNMKEFVRVAQEAGVLSGDSFEEFSVVAGTSLEDFAKAMGLSEDATYAYLEMLSDYTIGGESLVGQLEDVKYDKGIEDATDNLEELVEKKAELLRSGDYNPEDMQQLNADIETAKANLDAANQAAINHANQYSVLAALNAGLSGGIELTQEELNSLVSRLSQVTGEQYTISADGTQLLDAEGNVVDIQSKLSELGSKPTTLEVQLAYKQAEQELNDLQAKKESIEKNPAQARILFGLSEESDLNAELDKINKQIDERQAQLKTLEIMYGIKPSADEDTSVVEQFRTWESDGINTTLNVDTAQATQDNNAFRQEAEKPVETTLIVNTATGETNVETTGSNGMTVDFHVGPGYQEVLNALAYLTAQTKIPIEQKFSVNDKGTIKTISDSLTDLNDQTIEDKSFELSMDGYTTVESQLSTILDDLTEIDNMSATATITVNTVKTETIQQNVQSSSNNSTSSRRTLNNIQSAYANGSTGLQSADKNALIGELGPETVVDPIAGKYYTVGENGAEFVDLPKGAIIFDHEQTKELLKNGKITSRGKVVNGNAFAKGNAYAKTYTKHYNWTGTQNTTDTFYNTSGSLKNAADDLSDAADKFEEVFDWVEVRLGEIDERLSLREAQIENAVYYNSKNDIIDDMIGINIAKIANLTAGMQEYSEYATKLLAEVPAQYREAAQNGAIAITEFAGEADEVTVKAIENYREWAQKVADLRQELEETKTTIRDLAIQRIDNAYEFGDVRAAIEDSQTQKLQNAVDYDEERGLITSGQYYTAMMENSNKKIEYWTESLKAMQEEFNKAVENGEIEVGSNEWYEQINQLYEVSSEIDNATKELEEFQNAINDIYWDNFDELINRIDYLYDETENLISLMDKADMVTKPEGRTYEGGTIKYWTADDVEWTKEGIATLGLYAQQMEIAEYKAKQYAKAIDDLTKDYQDGKYSENEYLEKLNELKDTQYDSIEAYYDAQNAIKDLNSTRIDSIKDGIQKQIDAYEELINKQKEELDAEKDLHDFQKSIADQQKNISDIERKLAALANDNSISATAQRKRLEAELAEAQYELEEMYYDRSVEDKQDALDKELDSFQKEKEEESAKWDEYLENIEQIVADSLNVVQANASDVYNTLNDKANEYNLTLSDAILTPWKDGALAVSDYQSIFDTAASSTTDQLIAMESQWQKIIDRMNEAAEAEIRYQNEVNASYAAAKKLASATVDTKPSNSNSSNGVTNVSSGTSASSSGSPAVGSSVTVKSSATNFSGNSGGVRMASFVPGGTYTVYQVSGGQVLIGRGGVYTGWVNKSDLVGYAKGTKEIKEDQLALVDDLGLGEELVLHAGPDGRLQYLSKGSSVIPAKLTENLMKLGQLDPQAMLDQNRPAISAPHIVNNSIELSMDIGEVVHIDTVTNDTIPDLTKAVEKQLDKYMKNLNAQVRKYSR